MATQAFKVVLLGEGRVGKTCLCLRYVQGSFSDSQESTIQATYLDKRINIGKQSIKLMIWDTAGQERFHALGPIYYRFAHFIHLSQCACSDANGALLVYDITDRDSFTKVRHWVKELRKIVGKNIVLVIAGNKSDLQKNRQVNEEEALEYAKSVGAEHVACSAKSGKGVDQAFLELTKGMMAMAAGGGAAGGDTAGAGGATAGSSKPGKSSRNLVVIEDEKDNKPGGCCS